MAFALLPSRAVNLLRITYLAQHPGDDTDSFLIEPYGSVMDLPAAHEEFCIGVHNELQQVTMSTMYARCESPPIAWDINPARDTPTAAAQPDGPYGYGASSHEGTSVSLEREAPGAFHRAAQLPPPNEAAPGSLRYTKTIRKTYKKGISKIFARKHAESSRSVSSDDIDTDNGGDTEEHDGASSHLGGSGTPDNTSLLTANAGGGGAVSPFQAAASSDFINRIDHEVEYFSDSDFDFTDLDDWDMEDDSLIDSDSFDGHFNSSYKRFDISAPLPAKPRSRRHKPFDSSPAPRSTPPPYGSEEGISAALAEMDLDAAATTLELQKVEVVPLPTASKLSALLSASVAVHAQPLSKFAAARGIRGDTASSVALKVYIPTSTDPGTPVLEEVVRRESLVFEVIGYLLYRYAEGTSLTDTERDPNQWCLRLADEDGEPYDGSFGLLNRTDLIAGSGADEVALCRVSALEYTKNSIETPFAVASADASTGPSAAGGTAESMTVKVYLSPHAESNFKEYVLDSTATVRELLETVCQDRALAVDTHQLRVIPHHTPLSEAKLLNTLSSPNLELVGMEERRDMDPFATGTLNTGTLNTLPSVMALGAFRQNLPPDNPNGPAAAAGPAPAVAKASSRRRPPSLAHTAPQSPALPGMLAQDFHKWSVVRREPIAFNNRLEKSLIVDGDYIYLVPNDEKKTWYDPNARKSQKTSTIHLSQLVGIKKSKKYPTGFKLVVLKVDRLKTYYLEAHDEKLRLEIVKKVHSILKAYREQKEKPLG